MSEGGTEEGKPNLTPILDMVFQLITFFMIVATFKAAELDENLRLPVVGSARIVEYPKDASLLLLNVEKDGLVKALGKKYTGQAIVDFIANEAKRTFAIERLRYANLKDDDLPTIVVVRADSEVPFKYLIHVIKACQEHGFREFALKAMQQKKKAEGT